MVKAIGHCGTIEQYLTVNMMIGGTIPTERISFYIFILVKKLCH